jgi:pimeloyl-ACP methyl ester carboxylesterase
MPRRFRFGTFLRRRPLLFACLFASGCLALPAASVSAKPHEVRMTLKDGKVPLSDLADSLCRELGVTSVHVPVGNLDVSGLKGSNFVAAVNESLGDACRVTITPDALVLHVDVEKLPRDCDAARRAVRLFTAIEAPEATAAQRKYYGLHLPDAPLDAKRPLVVLVHGLDSERGIWSPMIRLLNDSGYQTAFFAYQSDGPVRESAELLARNLAKLRDVYPGNVDLVCHSMGGLVARQYVEGEQYAGGVDRLILCGTPNAGTTWNKYRMALEIQEHYHLWRSDPDWSPTWMITDGLGEAGDDLRPDSPFLKALNALPRRTGVRYTIIAGNQHPASRIGADWLDCTASWIPNFARSWWGFRQCDGGLRHEAESLRLSTGDGDGPVPLKSTKLPGVSDYVVLRADHASLVCGDAPAAWPVIRERLGH